MDDSNVALLPNSPPKEPKRKTLVVVLLVGINLLNYLDRYTIAGVLPNLKDHTQSGFSHDLSDGQGGLLMTVFIVSYMLFSPVFGYYGDRWNRKYLITLGIVFWSIFTVMGSFATSYGMLLGARAMVGIGEASYATIAPTLIADLFHVEVRTKMLSVFYIAIPVGSAMGFIIGGQVASALDSWRWAMRISPPLGFVLALLLFFLTEDPPRGAMDGGHGHGHGDQKNASSGLKAMWDDCKEICANKSFLWSTIGFTAVTFTSGALAQWAPTFIYRESQRFHHQYSSATASLIFGAITCVTGIVGTTLGAALSKHYMRVTQAADGYVCGMGLLLAVPFMSLGLGLAPFTLAGAWVFVFIGEVFLCLNWAPAAAIILYVIKPERRSTAESLGILFTHLFGDAFSPYLVGAVSDSLKERYDLFEGDALQYAMFIACAASFFGGLAFLRSAKYIPQDRIAAAVVPEGEDYRLINEGGKEKLVDDGNVNNII